MATAAEINTKVDVAVSAMDSGDWATAFTKLLQAKAMLAGKPDTKHGSAGELTWDRNAIDSLISDVRRQRHAGAGIQTSNVKYVPTTDTP